MLLRVHENVNVTELTILRDKACARAKDAQNRSDDNSFHHEDLGPVIYFFVPRTGTRCVTEPVVSKKISEPLPL